MPRQGCRVGLRALVRGLPLPSRRQRLRRTGATAKRRRLSAAATRDARFPFTTLRPSRVFYFDVAQGGDFVKNNGSGGESVFGKKFKDDLAGLKVRARRESARRDSLPAARAAT